MSAGHDQRGTEMVPIGEAARIVGVSVETLRRWERDGRISPTRTLGGQRRYAREDLERLIIRPAS